MSNEIIKKIKNKNLLPFLKNNLSLDLLHFDFHNKKAIKKLKWSFPQNSTFSKKATIGPRKRQQLYKEATLELLKSYQRILRLHNNPALADHLHAKGLDSAHKISAMSERRFVSQLEKSGKIKGGDLQTIHRKAVDIKQRVALLYGNVKDSVASPFYNATLFANTSAKMVEKYSGIPGYTDLFGTLDYCSCEHCQSIFSPAAYFVDLMRLINEYITDPNQGTIPVGYTLNDRRPDLFQIPLDCDNTNTLVPYLQISNGVIATKLSNDLGVDTLEYLATTTYPFNTPYNQPLTQVRTYINHFDTSLSDIYKTYMIPELQVARESLGITLEQLSLLTTPTPTEAPLSKDYGVTISGAALGGLKDAAFFAYQTGMTLDRLKTLIYQHLNDTEIATGTIPHLFFINLGLAAGQYLKLEINSTDPNNTFLEIVNLNLDALDRLNRFIRLADILKWDFADLDYFMQSFSITEITDSLITKLAKAEIILKKYSISVQVICSFWNQINTFGVGIGNTPKDLFDSLFNYPNVFYNPDHTDPPPYYHPLYNLNPLYTDAVITWEPDGVSSVPATDENAIIRSRLVGTLGISDDSLSLIAQQVMNIQSITDGKILMNIDNMTLLYRLSKQAQIFKLPPEEYLLLLSLLDKQQVNTLDDLLSVITVVDWMKASRINVYEIQFISTGDVNKYVNIERQDEEIRLFMDNLWRQSAEWLATPSSYINENLTQESSQQIFRQLITKEYINTIGIVLAHNDADFTKMSNLIQLNDVSFITNLIDEPASQQAFADLETNAVLTGGYLVESFSDQTDLSFLFGGSPLQEDQIEQVRSILIEIKNLSYHIAVQKESFIANSINTVQSEEAFNLLVSNNVIEDHGVLLESVDENTDLSYLFPGAPNQETMIAEVRATLMLNSSDVFFVLDTLNTLDGLQTDGTTEALSSFYEAPTSLLAIVLEFSAEVMNIDDYILLLLTPVPDGQTLPLQTYDLLHYTSRTLFAALKLNLTVDEVNSIMTHPQSYGIQSIGSGFVFTIAELMTVYTFKQLIITYNDDDNGFITYFTMPEDPICSEGEKSATLAKITGWNQQQICTLITTYLPNSQEANSVGALAWMNKAFGISSALNVDVYYIMRLIMLNDLPATSANWSTYLTASTSLLDVVNAKYNDEAWKPVYDVLIEPILESERNVLIPFAIWFLRQAPYNIPLMTPDDLYQFLLIDVSMGGCAQISYIKEGLSAGQLYIQRSRMNLEPGIDILAIPDVWWSWMANYRVWEANRKVFLYPENYLDPILRKGKSPDFDELRDNLLQGDVTDDRVSEAYMKYFDKLNDLGNLKIAGSYYRTIEDPVWGDVKTLFIFGRTADSPYTYYYRSAVVKGGQYVWSPWEAMGISIGGEYVNPVYAFDKLFIFWVETERTTSTIIRDNESVDSQVHKTSIKYSYYNFNKTWIQAQELSSDIISYFFPDQAYITQIQDYIGKMNINLQQSNLYWNKPYPLDIVDPDGKESIVVLYGDIPNLPPSNTAAPPRPAMTENSNQNEFNNSLYNSISRAVNATNEGLIGYGSLMIGGQLTTNFRDDYTNLILQNYNTIGGSPKPYRASIDVNNNKLNVIQTNNVLYDNYMGDMVSRLGNGLPPSTGETLALMANLSSSNASITMVKNQPGWFTFDNGDEAFLAVSTEAGLLEINEILRVNNNLSDQTDETDLLCIAYTSTPTNFPDLKFQFIRISTSVVQQLSRTLFTGGLDALLTIESQLTPELPFSRFQPTAAVVPPPSETLNFDGAYGNYFWEVFFYIPFMVANSLSENQRFEEAQKWYQYIFNPTTRKPADTDNPNDRYWGFLPFWGVEPESLESILTNSAQIAIYENDPFDPDAIAHLRPSAFQKAIVMKYIDNLLNWGDFLFSQDTWESIINATMLYVMAKELLGEKPVQSGVCEKEPTATFQDILDKYGDEIPVFLIQLENALPASGEEVLISEKPYNDIESYFCVPENPKFQGYWDTVEDRLFKIRHCMNILGEERQLALFQPPIDPMDLIKATMSGRDITSVISALVPQIPAYRFSTIFNQAKGVTASLIQLGSSLLSALEKKDAEQLAMLRLTQEEQIQNISLRVKEQQLEQTLAQLDSLRFSYQSAQARNNYYTQLIAVGLIPKEILNIQAMTVANVLNMAGGIMKMAASIAKLVPNVGSPFAMTYGGKQIGGSLSAVGSYFDMLAGFSSFIASMSLTMAGYERREKEWELQQTLSGFDMQQIEKQIEASTIATSIAEQEITRQRTLIEQNNELQKYYTTKFTDEELYQWMVNRLSTLYFQTYKLAFDLALLAEKAYQYERDSTTSFIDFGYWDSLKKGLLSGEALQLALNQLELAYINEGSRKLQIQKNVSLLMTDPLALIDLKSKGECLFAFDEASFDLDYPGHYRRQIKSVNITIPAIVGPYQNIKATLIQLTNKVILQPDLNAVNYLLGGEDALSPDNSILRSNWKANQQIALSTGVNDSGMFQLNFGDERYLPFEGTGAISTWKLEMSKATNTIDFESISDIIIQVNYEAVAGDSAFKKGVTQLPGMQSFAGSALLSLSQQYSSEWYTFMNPADSQTEQTMTFSVKRNVFRNNLSNLTLEAVSLFLQLENDATLDGTLKADLMILLESMQYSFTNINIAEKEVPNSVSDYFGNWSIVIKKTDIPASLQDANGYLNPEILLNIGVLISYTGNMEW